MKPDSTSSRAPSEQSKMSVLRNNNNEKTTLLDLPPAALWKRLFAIVYDSLVLGAITLLYFAIATYVFTALLEVPAENYRPNTQSVWVQIGWVCSLLLFYCFFWMRVGQTVAMKAWNLQLISSRGRALTLNQCLARCIIGFLGFSLGGLSYVWMLFDKDKLTLHDRLTQTRIVQLPKS